MKSHGGEADFRVAGSPICRNSCKEVKKRFSSACLHPASGNMKISILACLTALLILTPGVQAQTAANATVAPYGDVVRNYTLSWADEFDGPTLDLSKWSYRVDDKGWSAQVAANVSVANGNLVIALKKEKDNEHVDHKAYTAGGVISNRTFEYGYYEARFKVPPGSGWHTSFWTAAHGDATKINPKGQQEIDICEQDSVTTKKYSAGVIAWEQRAKGYGRKGFPTPDLAADFHVWGCEFTPTVVRFFFDGKLTHETDATRFKHGPQNIWLTSISIGLGGTHYVDNSRLPATAEFDYVRFFDPPPATP